MHSIVLYFILTCLIISVTSTDINDIGVNGFAASRSLLAKDLTAEPTKNGTVYNYENCTMLYTRSLILETVKPKEKPVEFYNFSTVTALPKVSGSCSNTTKGDAESTLNVEYTGLSGNITDFSMKMTYNATKSGRWELTELLVSMTCAKDAPNCKSFKDLAFDADFVKSQRGFSFHCYRPPRIHPIEGKKNETDIRLSFNKLQVQPYDIKNGRFSYADDCVGFFSSGIWSGLFVTLILTLIFAYGIIMINNISVTDRFDDPKGPGIQVNVQE